MSLGTDRSEVRELTLTRADLIEAHRAALRRRFGHPRAWLWLLIAVAAVYGAGFVLEHDFTATLIQAGCFIVAFPAALLLSIPWRVQRSLRIDRRFGGPWILDIAPDALRVANPGGETRYLWSGLAGRLETSNLLLLMTGSDSFIPVQLRALRPGDRDLISRRLDDAGA